MDMPKQSSQLERRRTTQPIEELIIAEEPLRKPGKFNFGSDQMRETVDVDFSRTTKTSMVMRKDPHEEFFKLTLLAFKLNNKMSNSVLTVSQFNFLTSH